MTAPRVWPWPGGDEEQRDQLKRVCKADNRLPALITAVIDISKFEAEKIDPYLEEFALEGVVNDALSELKLDIREKDLKIEDNEDTMNIISFKYACSQGTGATFSFTLSLESGPA
jgi:K+-sensing histidine kinase KdpD